MDDWHEQSMKTAVVRIQKQLLKQESQRIIEEAKVLRPSIPHSCPHSMVERVSKSLFICVDCHWRVYPDPEWFERGFLIYGNREVVSAPASAASAEKRQRGT